MTPTGSMQGSTPADAARGRPLLDLVLETIWCSGPLSRADLSRELGLSRSTVSELVSRLLDTDLVAEGVEGPSRGGRRPILLEFRDDAHLILGIEMGASHVGVALTDLRGRVLWFKEEDHPVREDPEGTRAHMRALCETALGAVSVPDARERLMGIGIAVPSPVDPRYPDRMAPEVLPRWEGRTGFSELAEAFGVPILIDNDANLGAVAELWWGAGQDADHFTFIKLATGIGAGHIVKGEVYRGATSVAGEIGHVSVDPAGEPCICGNRGCLTTFAGTRALLRRAKALEAEYPDSVLSGAPVTLRALEQATLSGDALANEVIREAAHHLGVAISGMLNLMNPGAVILGGSLTRVGDALLVPLRKAVVRRTLVSSVAASEIRLSSLGDSAIALGGATYVLSSALADPSLFPTYRS